ncbi:MAG: acyl-CoA thioesterase [Maricaulis sp.]|jgi:4-hydroxybenzoyl-CoA thioesterase|uniref:acyl-CoA thioesterase n=1 Tax=Maricaulis sp. TaxID=1486257 RepID=UPI001B14C86B|nr:thioesterase family protein [Maricaulis sp.]MBO6846482.1 acyl-CoA thioesterase [Maricaulis sp.]MBO6876713.1 acyl-CoA thioesterase [Maricaulis sp.]
MSFTHRHKVGFADVDPAGIVFYPRYFEMINATIEDWFRSIGYGFDQMIMQDGFGVPTATIQVDFKAPSRLDDLVELELQLVRLGRSSIGLQINIQCEGELRAVVQQTLVFIRMEGNKPVRIPDSLRAGIERSMEDS